VVGASESYSEFASKRQASLKQYLLKTFFAYIYAALGEKKSAFAMLEQAIDEHDINLLGLKTHPWFNPLRSDKRFPQLLKRVGLPESP
jgi:hypothetical protein